MGQYFKPVNLDKKQWLYSHDFGNGLKLMEHSYIGNDLMEAVEILLTPFGPWHKCKLVWAGDYADAESKNSKLMALVKDRSQREEWNVWSIIDDENGFNQIAPYEIEVLKEKHNIKLDEYKYICNHSRKVYINKDNIEKFKAYTSDETGEDVMWRIHPLSLLTAEGNGRGGGDYYEDNPEFDSVGVWARDVISIEKEIPNGFEEVSYEFKE